MEVLSAVFVLCLSKISSVQPYVHSTPFHPKIFHYNFASFYNSRPNCFSRPKWIQFFAFSLKWMGVVWYFLVCLYQAKKKLQLRWNVASFLMTLSGGGTWTSLSKHSKIVDFGHFFIHFKVAKQRNMNFSSAPLASQMYLTMLRIRIFKTKKERKTRIFFHSKNGCLMVSFIFSLVITQL